MHCTHTRQMSHNQENFSYHNPACCTLNGNVEQSESILKERLYANPNFCISGFLTANEHVSSIIEQDNKTLAKHGFTHAQIAHFLHCLVLHYSVGKNLVLHGKVFKIECKKWLGCQRCAFQPITCEEYFGCEYGSSDYTITSEQGEVFRFGTLLIHLIHDHHFFEGSVPYRVCPEKLITFFDLKPSEYFFNKYHVVPVWNTIHFDNFNTPTVQAIQETLTCPDSDSIVLRIHSKQDGYTPKSFKILERIKHDDFQDLILLECRIGCDKTEKYLFYLRYKGNSKQIFEFHGATLQADKSTFARLVTRNERPVFDQTIIYTTSHL
jgi:hypothetical protein